MLNISTAFRQELNNNNRNYLCYADFTLENSTTFTITNDRIWSSGFSIDDAVSDDNTFASIGAAIINSATITIDNTDEQYSDYDFTNAGVILRIGLIVDDEPEIIKKGTFIVDDTHYNDGTITFDLLDYMGKFDKPYDTNLVYPATLDLIVRDACTKCGVPLASSSLLFPHRDYVVAEKPPIDSTTFRDIISYSAQIAGCFARCNVDGQLELKWFETDYIERFTNYDGGYFDGGRNDSAWLVPYMNTQDGMTTVRDSYIDDAWYYINNEVGFRFNDAVSSRIYIHSDSAISFSNTQPSKPAHSTPGNINICMRDGSAVLIKSQYITSENGSAVKIYFDGYSRYGNSYMTDAYHVEYEIFFIYTGKILINFINIPTLSGYLGQTNIIENGVTTTITPVKGKTAIYERGQDNIWVEKINSSYQSGDNLDGGSFNPWNIGDEADAGNFTDTNHLHIIDKLYSQDICVDDVVITQIRILVEIDYETSPRVIQEFSVGEEGYTIEIDRNPFITVNTAPTVLEWFRVLLLGLKFRKLRVTTLNDPSIEAGDVAIVYDRKWNAYPTLITRTEFAVTGVQTIVCGAETPSRNSATQYASTVKNYIALRESLQKERTAWEAAEEELSQRIANANGMYQTDVTSTSGTIHYLHNKPLLEDSAIRIMISDIGVTMTANALDTTPIWYGLTVDGTLITAILNTIGINADWINSGSISIKDSNNNETFFADTATGIVRIKASSFSLSGNTIDQIARTATAGIQYATCSTAASTAAKSTGSTPANFSLVSGVKVTVRFTNANTASSPTLNVNGTGAKYIYAVNSSGTLTNITAKDYWTAGSLVDFVYNGSQWVMQTNSQQEIFNWLTNGGTAQGIWMQNGQLYINMSYLQTGTLKVGGSNNGNGIFEVYNSYGTRVGRWDNGALYIGNISSALTSPNTKIDTAGAITTKSLTANDYVYVNGNNNSYLKIPSTDGYLEVSTDFYMQYYTSSIKTTGYNAGSYPGLPQNIKVCALEFRYSNNVYSEIAPHQIYIWNSTVGSTVIEGGALSINNGNSKYFYIEPVSSKVRLDYYNVQIFDGNVSVSGTKSRNVATKDYGKRLLYCYETPSPMFGDVGEGIIGEDGICYIQIDPTFSETISTRQYQVFLQAYGDGKCYVTERKGTYFIVAGEPNLAFGWEIKAKQSDFTQLRLEKDFGEMEQTNTYYGELALEHIIEINKEREGTKE